MVEWLQNVLELNLIQVKALMEDKSRFLKSDPRITSWITSVAPSSKHVQLSFN